MMKNPDILKNSKGAAVMVTVLLILALMTVIGIVASTTTSTDVKITRSERMYQTALYAADSGIDVARETLNTQKELDAGAWDVVLSGAETLDNIVGSDGLQMGEATFSLAMQDNDDLDGNPAVDTDNIVRVTSTGTYKNADVIIVADVRYRGGGDQYAQEHYDTDSSGKASKESDDIDLTRRW